MEGSLVADGLPEAGPERGQSGAAGGGVLQLRENGLLGERPSVGLSVGAESVGTQGKVSITSRRVVWVPDDPQSCSSCSVDLSHVVMHAQSSPAEEGREGCTQLRRSAGRGGGGEETVETLELVRHRTSRAVSVAADLAVLRSDARVPERGLTSTNLFLSPDCRVCFFSISGRALRPLCDGVVMNPDEGFLGGEDGGWDGGHTTFRGRWSARAIGRGNPPRTRTTGSQTRDDGVGPIGRRR